MRKLRITSVLSVCMLMMMVFLGTSCNKTSKKDVTFDTISVITHADTVRVLEQTGRFMELLKTQQLDSALNMLSEVDLKDSAYEIKPESRERLKALFTRCPVLNYEITNSLFKSTYDANVTYKYQFMKNPTDDPNYPCTMEISMNVVFKEKKFRLVLENSSYITQ